MVIRRIEAHSTNAHRTILSVVSAAASVLAHQGGWDEILLIGGPMLAIAGLLVLAKRRVDAAADAQTRAGDPAPTSGDGPRHRTG